MPNTLLRLSRACALAIFVAAAATARAETPPPPDLTADHPLAGRIWRASDGAFVAPEELARRLADAPFVLLGETHDNPHHHRVQAWAVTVLFAAGRRPGLALEMIDADRQEALDSALRASHGNIEGVGAALGWERSGWPAWEHYAPVVAPFAREKLPVLAANLARDALRAVADGGFEALGAGRPELALDLPLPSELLSQAGREMIEAHCGLLAAERALPFARAQVARDAALAQALIRAAQAAGQGGAVLIAGTGHVRRDRGVPLHVARQGAEGAVVALAPLEVRDGATRPEDYGGPAGSSPPFDFIWFTPRQNRGDPCDGFPKK